MSWADMPMPLPSTETANAMELGLGERLRADQLGTHSAVTDSMRDSTLGNLRLDRQRFWRKRTRPFTRPADAAISLSTAYKQLEGNMGLVGKTRWAMLTFAAVVLVACASGYSQFYRPVPGATPEVIAAERATSPSDRPLVERSSPPPNPDDLLKAYAKRGYIQIGSSTFTSGRSEHDEAAVEQAQKVGADLVVILDPRYAGSTTTALPFTTPTTTTSYSNGTATAYGPAGVTTAYGSGTTTMYGTKTTYIPVTINRTDYGAVYFIKKRWALGALWHPLTDAERQQLQSNKGIGIEAVVDDTPAFAADILAGDLLLSVDDDPVMGQESVNNLLWSKRGQRVTLTLYRHGQTLQKQLTLTRPVAPSQPIGHDGTSGG